MEKDKMKMVIENPTDPYQIFELKIRQIGNEKVL